MEEHNTSVLFKEVQSSTEQKKDVQDEYLVDIMSTSDRKRYLFLVSIWLISLLLFLNFWFQAGHIVGWLRHTLNTLLILWSMLLPGYFYFFVYQMKKVNPKIKIPEHWKVAMVVTRAPSEPFEMVKKTLRAMLNQDFHHDTWLADEDPDEEIVTWCLIHGVQVSSRKNIAEYHRKTWPRRTKCKEGNLAYFYDHYGYENYDFVVQLDADHVPGKDYLKEMLRPFVHSKVGYVSAPSICDTNAKTSWAARGRLYAESIMHGALQAGYCFNYAPLCIGSHYAIRTKALKEVGGLGPELAEDHSTTLMLNAGGWKGVHALDATASGEGPQTFKDCMVQEFQWSRSLMIILVTLLPKYWSKLSRGSKMQFLFSELWFLLFGATMMLGFLLPIIAVITGVPWVTVSFFEFLLHSIPVTVSIIAIVWFIKERGLLRPVDAPMISWEATWFHLVRWPWALYGSLMGLYTGFSGKTPSFKVTPKGCSVQNLLDWQLMYPYIAIILLSFLPIFISVFPSKADGYNFFLILNMWIYIGVLSYIIIRHRKEAKMINERRVKQE